MVKIFLILFFISSAQTSVVSANDERTLVESRILRLALDQAKAISGYWDPAQRDCSGLVRFLYRRSLGEGFKGWLRADKKRYDYASAEDLIHYNFQFVTHKTETSLLRTGDVLAFYSENKKPEDRFHLMVVLKSPYQNTDDVLLVYHNGSTGKNGAVRKVSLKNLKLELNNEWSPTPINPRFRGVYRWKGWQEKT